MPLAGQQEVRVNEPLIGYGEPATLLAEALGLSGQTMSFTLDVSPDRLITVRSTQLVAEDQVREVAAIFNAEAGEDRRPLREGARSIPRNRTEDLIARAESGTLTNAERLALAVLAGDESALPPLIDAAAEEYGHGGYRVPVRVVADRARVQLVITPPLGAEVSMITRERLEEAVNLWRKNEAAAIVLPPGYSLQVYEFGEVTE